MKTVGERIRQAREFRGLTGEELAKKVGYKTQSGISNLENRATGRGGFMLPKIAQELDVSIDWLLEGSESDDMSLVPPYSSNTLDKVNQGTQPEKCSDLGGKYSTLREQAHKIIDEISDVGLTRLMAHLEDMATIYPARTNASAGVLVPAPSETNIKDAA